MRYRHTAAMHIASQHSLLPAVPPWPHAEDEVCNASLVPLGHVGCSAEYSPALPFYRTTETARVCAVMPSGLADGKTQTFAKVPTAWHHGARESPRTPLVDTQRDAGCAHAPFPHRRCHRRPCDGGRKNTPKNLPTSAVLYSRVS
jgi:hypothetical protein